jgi:aldose 1-epimerase
VKALSHILLRDGAVTVGLAPECGCLTRLDVRAGGRLVEILRPASERYADTLWALGTSSFPMLPYCGRLREGRFQFRGRSYRFPLNALPERHSSHGDAWTRRWELTRLDHRSAVMTLGEDPSSTIRYECTQALSVTGNRVEFVFAMRNQDPEPIPMGVGIHPYFANRSLATIRARLPLRWELDRELMPVAARENPNSPALSRGQRVVQLPVVGEYAGWDGTATIEWPGLGVEARIESNPPLEHAVMWVPEGEDFFCFEPTSHATDALNGYPGHAPGEGFVTLEPRGLYVQRFAIVVAFTDARQ